MMRELIAKNRDYLTAALSRARDFLQRGLNSISKGGTDPQSLTILEDLLIEADFGPRFAEKVVRQLQQIATCDSKSDLRLLLKSAVLRMAVDQRATKHSLPLFPKTVMVVGVNGHGKTTSCAKLAALYQSQGHRPLLIPADTFRAAAGEQLQMWSTKLNVEIAQAQRGAQPAAVVFDGIKTALSQKFDLSIIDSAGRLHNQPHLLMELQKMQSICSKLIPEGPHEVLIAVEAPTGQNAIDQVKQFASYLPLTGIVLTKLDGSAKGGIALALQEECQIPIRYVGMGEGADDFKKFELRNFVDTLFAQVI